MPRLNRLAPPAVRVYSDATEDQMCSDVLKPFAVWSRLAELVLPVARHVLRDGGNGASSALSRIWQAGQTVPAEMACRKRYG